MAKILEGIISHCENGLDAIIFAACPNYVCSKGALLEKKYFPPYEEEEPVEEN